MKLMQRVVLGVKGLKKRKNKKVQKNSEESESSTLALPEQNESILGAGDVSTGAKGDDSQVDSVPSIEGSIPGSNAKD